MTKIFLLVNDSNKEEILNNLSASQFEFIDSVGEMDDYFTQIGNEEPDVVLIDSEFENVKYIIRHIKSETKNNSQIVLLQKGDKTDLELMNLSDSIVSYPINYEILSATLNSRAETKVSLDRLYENNKELSRSLYQLNVLYNTSSQFAGTLNTQKLYDIMLEAMEKTLSFDISAVLVFNSLGKPVFLLNTMHAPSENLVNALKIRSILNYDAIYKQTHVAGDFDFENIEVIQKVKQTRSNKIFGIETVSYDTLFAPIKVGEDFFGVVELFRQKPFLNEDVTCFQAIAHQVALPLRSAKLYEEISITNKKLEKLEKLKSEFVSIVSHELRTPLTPINNSLEIVLSNQAGEITEDTRNFISMAKRNIQRLSGIIEDLLDLSRIQTGKMDFRYKNINIIPSLELLSKTFGQIAKDKNIKINLNIDENLPDIYADTRRVEQIFTNLVSNSLKFTSDGGKIDIFATVVQDSEIDKENLVMPKVQPAGKYIKISVKDTGIGINKEDIPKIFDKFSQIESSLNRNKGGVGLGLTITKQLVDSHLGLIEVVSKEHKGACFNVYLPCLSDFKTFIMDLSKALINSDVGLVKIECSEECDVINSLKENKILNLTRSSKELNVLDKGKIVYYAFFPDITTGSFDAICSTLKDFTSKEKYAGYDIMLSKVHSSKANHDAVSMIEKLN